MAICEFFCLKLQNLQKTAQQRGLFCFFPGGTGGGKEPLVSPCSHMETFVEYGRR